jgi:beta-lactamase class A
VQRLIWFLLLFSGALFAQTPAAPDAAPNATPADQAPATPNAASNAAPAAKQQLMWKLEAEIAQTDRELDGLLGVAITDLTSGQQLLHNADQVFPTASVIKLAVLAELYRQEEQGAAGAAKKVGAAGAAGPAGAANKAGTAKNARLADLYTVRKEDLVADSDILGGLTPGVSRITNRDLAQFVVAVSDNAAANVLIERVGMENVNALLDSLGLKQTRLRRKMLDLAAAKQGRENVATPRELAALLEAIFSGKVFEKPLAQKSLADDFFKLLSSGRTHYKAYFRAGGIPDDVVIAEKEGQLEGVRADCGVVFVPGRPFVLCVMTSYLTDERAGEAAISRIAGAAYRTFDRLGRASPYGRIISPRNSGTSK